MKSISNHTPKATPNLPYAVLILLLHVIKFDDLLYLACDNFQLKAVCYCTALIELTITSMALIELKIN